MVLKPLFFTGRFSLKNMVLKPYLFIVFLSSAGVEKRALGSAKRPHKAHQPLRVPRQIHYLLQPRGRVRKSCEYQKVCENRKIAKIGKYTKIGNFTKLGKFTKSENLRKLLIFALLKRGLKGPIGP